MREQIGTLLLNASVMALAGTVLIVGAIVLVGKAIYLRCANWGK